MANEAPALTIGHVKPPVRVRESTEKVSDEILAAFAEAFSSEDWTTNGVVYTGKNDDEAKKKASDTARMYRRDLARHLSIEERECRSRVWAQDGGYMFALLRRSPEEAAASGENGDAAPEE